MFPTTCNNLFKVSDHKCSSTDGSGGIIHLHLVCSEGNLKGNHSVHAIHTNMLCIIKRELRFNSFSQTTVHSQQIIKRTGYKIHPGFVFQQNGPLPLHHTPRLRRDPTVQKDTTKSSSAPPSAAHTDSTSFSYQGHTPCLHSSDGSRGQGLSL